MGGVLDRASYCASLALGLALFVFSLSAIFPLLSLYSWHEHQRIAEIALLLVVSVLCLWRVGEVNVPLFWSVFLFFLLGLLSVIFAAHPEWAVKEWARFFGLFLLVVFVSRQAEFFWQACGLILLFVGLVLSFQFLTYYLMAFLSGVRNLSPQVLLYGFDNPRFLGQFQVVLIPVLMAVFVRARESGLRGLSNLAAAVLVVQWCMAWLMGGRGFLVAYIVAIFSVLLVGGYFRFIVRHAVFFVIGLLLYFVLFKVVPFLLDFDVGAISVFREGLSGREFIWRLGVEMFLGRPFLGVGPMHYSAFCNHVAAHPHQLLILVFCEWGVFSGLLFLLFAFRCFGAGFIFLRRGVVGELDLAAWLVLVGAFVLAQVDGVLVMPYGEVWLAVLAGVALARWRRKGDLAHNGRFFIPFIMLSIVVFFFVLFSDAPNYLDREASFVREHSVGGPPRFWGLGWIPL